MLPDYPPSYEQGHRLFQMGRIHEAVEVFKAVLAQDADNVPALYLLGVSYYRMQEFRQAQAQFRKVIALDDGHYNGHYYLGLTLEQDNRLNDALIEYRLTLALKPDFTEAQQKLTQYNQALSSASDIVQQGQIDKTIVESMDIDRDFMNGGNLYPSTVSGNLIYKGYRRISSFSGTFVLMAICLLGSFIFWVISGFSEYVVAVAWVLTSLSVLLWLYLLVKSRTTKYSVYEHRIDFKNGIFSKHERSLWIYQIEDTSLTRSFLNLLTNDAVVHLQAEQKNFEIIGVGNSQFMKRLWQEIRDAALVQRRAMKRWWI
jgi:tetratricopeptide (TPR) repeat protein